MTDDVVRLKPKVTFNRNNKFDIQLSAALIAERRLLAAGESILRDEFARHRDGKLSPLLERLRTRTLSPRAAACALLRELHIGGGS